MMDQGFCMHLRRLIALIWNKVDLRNQAHLTGQQALNLNSASWR
jgi:hypothetical protein